MGVLSFLLFFSMIGHAQDTATPDSGAAPSARQQLDCHERFRKHDCPAFFKENPDIAKYAINCDRPFSALNELKNCGKAGKRAVKNLKELVLNIPSGIAGLSRPDPDREIQVKIWTECVQTRECKRASLEAAGADAPSDDFLDRINSAKHLETAIFNTQRSNKIADTARIQKLLSEAKTDEDKEKILEREIPSYARQKEEQAKSLWQVGLGTFRYSHKIYSCIATEVQLELVCHGIASLAVPGLALKVGSKAWQVSRALSSRSKVAAPVATAKARTFTTSTTKPLGDLRPAEVAQIQKQVDALGFDVYVVGSAAKGARRNVGSDLPLHRLSGPKAGTRSDIDYAVGASREDLANVVKFPDIDPGFGVRGVDYINLERGPIIQFRPGQPPQLIEGSGRYFLPE